MTTGVWKGPDAGAIIRHSNEAGIMSQQEQAWNGVRLNAIREVHQPQELSLMEGYNEQQGKSGKIEAGSLFARIIVLLGSNVCGSTHNGCQVWGGGWLISQ